MLPGVIYGLNYLKDEGRRWNRPQLSTFNAASGQWRKGEGVNFNGQTTGEASG